MSNEMEADPFGDHFVAGARCLVEVLDRRYLSTVINVTKDRLRLSFPTVDFPVDGMMVTLEFHDDQGYTRCETEVVEGAREVGDGLLVKKPSNEFRSWHRSAWRIPGDFTVQLKGHVHPRRYEAPVINVSIGGVLVKTHAELELGDNVDIKTKLPASTVELTLLGKVVHCVSEEKGADVGRLVGVRFISPEAAQVDEIRSYIRRRVRTLYPASNASRRDH